MEAVLFDWQSTLLQFEWDDELLAAGHRAGLAELGRAEDADELTAQIRERLPVLQAERLDYSAELREALGDVSDADLDRFLDAEHEAWAPARALLGGAHALLETLRDRGLRLGIVANTWPDPPRLVRRELADLGVAERVDAVVLSGEVGARKPDAAIFERALAEVEAEPFDTIFVGDRLVDDIEGAAAVGMTTVQALWFRADDAVTDAEPDFLAFTPTDVLNAVKRLSA